MPRQGTSSRLRDDAGSPADPAEPVDDVLPELDKDLTPSADAEALEAAFLGEDLPPATAPRPKPSRGVLPLILIAILGLAAGFAAVMLI